MKYRPNPDPDFPGQVEFSRIADALRTPEVEAIFLSQLNAAPARYTDGMVVYADGTNWNPDATNGEGVYCFYNSVWNYLG